MDRKNRAFRPGTQANIRSHDSLFIAFTQRLGFRDFPAEPHTLMALWEFLLRAYSAPKSVLNALASLKHFHLDCRFPVEAFEDRNLVLLRRALPLTVWTIPRPTQALPFGVLEQLCRLAETLGERGLVFSALMSVLFASMAWLSSLLPSSSGGFDSSRHPTLADVGEVGGEWGLRLKWAKNLQATNQAYRAPLLPRPGSTVRQARMGVPGVAPVFHFRSKES